MVSINIPAFSYAGSQQIVLRNVRINLQPGAVVLLCGENASGKSTLGRLLCGLLQPLKGNVLVDDKEVWRLRGRKRVRIAYYLGQEYLLSFYHSTIGGVLSHAVRCSDNNAGQLSQTINYGLPDINTTPLDLGSCAAWRLGLLCATIVDPRVLFIDEVPSLQSAANVECLFQTVQQRKRDNKITIVSYQRPINLKGIFTQEYRIVDGEVSE